ncbi:hypothetical protein BDV41DRAFT_555675 [Aspergillus transmontanensis]|uniref:Uncharacterized protein n=1 Tax=Aspergillus transmontanensis TaxID=1034304 RepID=A0A5N6VFQ3_9EURO|nr:hypothetical protein BDV41DRAFT_555675 [Aspergillus transmontanensis]
MCSQGEHDQGIGSKRKKPDLRKSKQGQGKRKADTSHTARVPRSSPHYHPLVL